MKILIVALLLFSLGFFGCTSPDQKIYTCSNGMNVSNLSDCPKTLESCVGSNLDYCGSNGLRYFNAVCDQQTGQYRYSTETCPSTCQNGKCVVLPAVRNMQNISEVLDSNCTKALYVRERKEYAVRVENLGFDNEGWCMFSYNYTPTGDGNATARTIPSRIPMSGNCSFFNNKTGRDQETLNRFGGCELEISSIMLVEENYDVLIR